MRQQGKQKRNIKRGKAVREFVRKEIAEAFLEGSPGQKAKINSLFRSVGKGARKWKVAV